MDFLFIGLSLGCAIFLGKIVMDYMNEVPIWKEKIDQADIEMAQYEVEIEDQARQRSPLRRNPRPSTTRSRNWIRWRAN